MSSDVEFVPRQREAENLTVHVLWMTSGLGCDGDSVAMTSATNPSLEDIIGRAIPGMPAVVIHNPVLAFENGAEFIQAFYDAEEGRLDPYVLIVEGAIGNEEINGDGHWSGLGTNPITRQPITTNEWIDRLSPKAATIVAVGTCATYGGIPAMKGNPTGAMGVPDYLGWKWRSRTGLPIVCVPGCPAQPDRFMPFMDEDAWGGMAANLQRFTYGPIFRRARKRWLAQKDIEPPWRKPGTKLTSGYEKIAR